MKVRLILSALGCLGTSCCTSSPTAPRVNGPVAGWHDAGLVLSSADQSAGGVYDLSIIGNRIIAGTASGKLFVGQQGSANWDTIPFPGGDSIYCQVALDSSVYFGTRSTGQVWQLTFPGRTWTNLQTGIGSGFRVNALSVFDGRLYAFIDAYNINDLRSNVKEYSGTPGTWTDRSEGWPKPDWTTGRTLDVNGVLYSTTYQTGLWKRNASDTQWQRVPDPVVPVLQGNGQYSPGTLDTPRSMAWYRDRLWVGYLIWGKVVQSANGTDSPWVATAMDSSSGYKRLPSDILAMHVWKDRLFAGGRAVSVPLVYVDGKGWRYLEKNWGRSDDGTRTTCGSDITLAFAGIGDTLYAAGCGHIYKLPWSEIP